jgi:hypothetical protein|nr:MAG TPA: hypothetical protein [Caudoviricetes sp.]DAM46317.1 MAG TPA: hypothetical protein [Caudoviricetes sp.]
MLDTIYDYILTQPSISFEQYFAHYILMMQDIIVEEEVSKTLNKIKLSPLHINKLIESELGGTNK